jgi:hypothetical protein
MGCTTISQALFPNSCVLEAPTLRKIRPGSFPLARRKSPYSERGKTGIAVNDLQSAHRIRVEPRSGKPQQRAVQHVDQPHVFVELRLSSDSVRVMKRPEALALLLHSSQSPKNQRP